jgi:hypothetical protein
MDKLYWWRRARGQRFGRAMLAVLLAGSVAFVTFSTAAVDGASARRAHDAGRLVKPAAGHLIVGRAITLPSELFQAGGAEPASLVSASQARVVAAAMWRLWETALITSNTHALSQLLAPGPMLTGVIDRCAIASTRCVYETTPRPIHGIEVVVPLEQTYPLYFLAETQTVESVNQSNGLTGEQPWVELQIFTKASQQASWRLSFDSGFDGVNGGQPPLLPFDQTPAGPTLPSGGQDLYNPGPHAAAPVATNQFLPLLAAYWQSYKDTGHTPAGTVFRPDGYTSGVGQQLALGRQGSVYLGYRRRYELTTDKAAGQWEFAASGGNPILCGSISDTETDTPLQGLLTQNPEESNYGVPLPAGDYQQIATTTDHQTCVYVVPGGELDAAGNTVYPWRVTGKPASSALAALETDYGVLITQVQQYEGQLLNECKSSQSTASACVSQFAQQTEHQFALFSQQLTGTVPFPPRLAAQVSSLVATARRLTLLSGQLVNTTDIPAAIAKITTGEQTLNHQYNALVRALS